MINGLDEARDMYAYLLVECASSGMGDRLPTLLRGDDALLPEEDAGIAHCIGFLQGVAVANGMNALDLVNHIVVQT